MINEWVYDDDTGLVFRDGKVVGSPEPSGYLKVYFQGKYVRLHRLAYILKGLVPPQQVDHINGIRGDNRWCNLRPASNMQNQYNRRGTSKLGHLKGAYYNKRAKVWYSLIRYDGKRKYLGTFKTEEEAHTAYTAASLDLHKEYSYGSEVVTNS